LPEAHTDFILSIIAEELGFVAAIFVVILFVGLFVCGMTISFKANDLFGRLLGFGVTMMISIQAAFNIGVVTGCLPTKGLALPFISYGGSSLVMAIVMGCVLLSIAQYSDEGDAHQPRSIKDRAHRF
jgi:cell division protein FtsW